MKILLLSSSYHPVLGGLQTATHALARQFIAAGHAVQVVTNRYPRTLPAAETIDGVLVHRWLFLNPWRSLFRSRRPDLFLASLYHGPAVRVHLHALMREFRPDVVNVHFPDNQIPLVLWLRRRFAFRLVVSLHGHEVERYAADRTSTRGSDSRVDAGGLRSLLRTADAITACSWHLLETAARLEPSVTANGTAICNGIDPARFQDMIPYRHCRPYILALGRLTWKKGFDLLFEALNQTGAGSQRVDLILAGEGEERPALEALARRLGLEGRIYFFGKASPAEVVQLLNGCLFLAVPSRSEPFGIVALEALAAGKPVMATQVGGMGQFLTEVSSQVRMSCGGNGMSEGRNGRGPVVLVTPTVEGIAEGLRERLALGSSVGDGHDLRAMIQSEYSWARVAQRYARVLDGPDGRGGIVSPPRASNAGVG